MEELSRSQRAFDALTRFVIRHAALVVVLGLIAGALGVWRAGKLRINQDLKALIPDNYPSVVRLDALSERIGSQSELIVEIKSPDRKANIAYGEALATRMRAMDDIFAHVEFRRDVEWFRDHALLFLPMGKLLDLRTRVIRRIRDEVRDEVVESVDDEAPTEPTTAKDEDDPLDLDDDELQKRYGAQYDVPAEFIETDDGDTNLMVLRARPLRPTTDVEFTQTVVQRMRETLGSMDEASFHPELEAAIRGEYEERSSQVSSMKKDLLGSSLYAIGILVLILVFHFKRLRAVTYIMVPLILSILVTLAASTFIFEWLNLVTAFIFVVLLGLGIDFGIHWLSRYEYERLRGLGQEDALRTAGALTGKDVAMGALSTAVMFSLFPIADFRGFSQYGVVACIGVITALLFTLTVLPALIVLVEKVLPWKARRWLPTSEHAASAERRFKREPRRLRGIAMGVIAVSLVLAALSLWKAPEIQFEYDFRRLGKKATPEAGPGGPRAKTFSDAIGRPDFGPALVMGENQEDGRLTEDLLRGLAMLTDEQMERLIGEPLPEEELKKNNPDPADFAPTLNEDFEEDPDDPFAKPAPDPFAHLQAEFDARKLSPESQRVLDIYPLEDVRRMRYFRWDHLSLWSFVPSRQEEKLNVVADIRKRIDDKYDELSGDSQEKVDNLRRYLKVRKPVALEDVPTWLKNRWKDNQGIYGRHVILWNRGSKVDYRDAKALYGYFFDLKVGPKGEHTVATAANYFVLPEIMDTLRRDGPIVLSAAMIAIFICLMLMFRSLRTTLLILVPLLVSVTWLAGLFYTMNTWDPLSPEFKYAWNLEWDFKLNLYNVITFSLLIGMGVDDGIHMVSRWIEEGRGSVGQVMRETGAAVTLTTITTSVGFGGLLMAGHVGLASLGWTAAVGIILCLIASVTTLPALLYLLGRGRE